MKKLVINIKTGKQEYLDMAPEEEARRLEEIARAEEETAREAAEVQKRKDALDRLKASVNADILDLLKYLDLI